MISDTWRGEGDSDGDSADSEAEDCLQHAGVYTAEEVSTRSANGGRRTVCSTGVYTTEEVSTRSTTRGGGLYCMARSTRWKRLVPGAQLGGGGPSPLYCMPRSSRQKRLVPGAGRVVVQS